MSLSFLLASLLFVIFSLSSFLNGESRLMMSLDGASVSVPVRVSLLHISL
jgi:hypothetical protein